MKDQKPLFVNKNLSLLLKPFDKNEKIIYEPQLLKKRFPNSKQIFNPSKKKKKKIYDPFSLFKKTNIKKLVKKVSLIKKETSFNSFFENYNSSKHDSLLNIIKISGSKFGNKYIPKNPFKIK